MNIKIRVWDSSDSKMIYRPYEYSYGIDHDGVLVATNYDAGGYEQNLEIMLSTGLVDRDGTEIYEGDVISDGHFKWVVEYQIDRFIGKLISHYNSKISDKRLSTLLSSRERAMMPISVIGHIYDINNLKEYRNDNND